MKTLKVPNLLQMFLGLLFIITVFLLIFPLSVTAQEWHTANQATVAWDAVTEMDNGDQIPSTDTLEYSVYVSDSLASPKDSSVVAWRGPELLTVVTLTAEGSYFVGIQAHRMKDGTELSQSIIVWSDDPVATNNTPWGLQFWLPPSIVEGLRPQTQ